MRRHLLPIVLCCLAGAAAHADEPGAADAAPQVSVDEAKALVKQYLDTLVKAAAGQPRKPKPLEVSKKLLASKKFIHPKTLELIASQEKRDLVSVGLATWHFAKSDYWLTEYSIASVTPSVLGTVVVETRETNWRVEEGGIDGEPEHSSYLVGRYKGKLYVVDKRRNGTFSKDSIRIGYKGYFDLPEEPKPEHAPSEARAEPAKPEPETVEAVPAPEPKAAPAPAEQAPAEAATPELTPAKAEEAKAEERAEEVEEPPAKPRKPISK